MNRCATCKHWQAWPYGRDARGAAGGLCRSAKIGEDGDVRYDADALVYPYQEGGEIWTGPEFGCVHWQAKG